MEKQDWSSFFFPATCLGKVTSKTPLVLENFDLFKKISVFVNLLASLKSQVFLKRHHYAAYTTTTL